MYNKNDIENISEGNIKFPTTIILTLGPSSGIPLVGSISA